MVRNNIDDLCATIGAMAKVNVEDIISPSREWPLPAIRGILYIHLRELGCGSSYIGKLFNRHHATVLAGVKRTQGWIESREPFVCDLYHRFQEVVQTNPLNTASENK